MTIRIQGEKDKLLKCSRCRVAVDVLENGGNVVCKSCGKSFDFEQEQSFIRVYHRYLGTKAMLDVNDGIAADMCKTGATIIRKNSSRLRKPVGPFISER